MGFAALYPPILQRLLSQSLQRRHASPGAPAPRGPGRRRRQPGPGDAPLERRRMRHGAGAPWRSAYWTGFLAIIRLRVVR